MPMTREAWDSCTCSLCSVFKPGHHGDERLIADRNEQRFELSLSLYRGGEDRHWLRAERQRRIASGEHPGELICVCLRCKREFSPWHGREELRCPECVDARWALDEDGVRTRATEPAIRRREERRSD